jgi:glucose-6-phosphate 1-epimerase
MTHCTPITYQGAQALRLHSPEAGSAVILLQGGQVVSWTDPAGQARLYLSPLSPLGGEQPVRGGVPVVFPQFSLRGPLVRHGFARTQPWRPISHQAAQENAAMATLELTESEATLALWPHAFRCELQVTLTPWQLDMRFTAHNTGSAPWHFCAALHTYLAAGPLTSVELDGLHNLAYEDTLQSGAVMPGSGAAIQPKDAIDRIYFNTKRPVALRSSMGEMALTQQGWPDTVVWNPGPEGARAMADLPDAGFDRFLCVEAALIGEPQLLAPGAQWQGTQTLRAIPAPTH